MSNPPAHYLLDKFYNLPSETCLEEMEELMAGVVLMASQEGIFRAIGLCHAEGQGSKARGR